MSTQGSGQSFVFPTEIPRRLSSIISPDYVLLADQTADIGGRPSHNIPHHGPTSRTSTREALYCPLPQPPVRPPLVHGESLDSRAALYVPVVAETTSSSGASGDGGVARRPTTSPIYIASPPKNSLDFSVAGQGSATEEVVRVLDSDGVYDDDSESGGGNDTLSGRRYHLASAI
jgi:hypothetical protein